MSRRRATLASVLAAAALLALWLGWWRSPAPQVVPVADVAPPRPAPPEVPMTPAVVRPEPAVAGEAQPEPDGVTVRCPLGVELPVQEAHFTEMIADGVTVRGARRAPAAVGPDALTFHAGGRSGLGLLRIDGHEAVQVRWDEGPDGQVTCLDPVAPLPENAWIEGVVRGVAGAGRREVRLEGCGFNPYLDRHQVDVVDGSFGFESVPRPCEIKACRVRGLLSSCGAAAQLDPVPQGDTWVELDVPDFQPAGIGIGLEVVDDGIGVANVHPGTPAARAGMQGGDLITRVAGESTEGMTTDDFIALGVGPRGTEVELEVEGADGTTRSIVIERDYLAREDPHD